MSKGKILVIDDSPIVRKLAEMALADEGYEVFTAENGEDGLRLAEEISPAVILVDFIMPRMSGYQFCQLLRENQNLKDTPIILITAKGDDVGRKFSERFAVSDYFIKPFKSEALVDKVNAIVLGQQPDSAAYEPPAAELTPESEVAIPFGGYEVEPPAALAVEPPAVEETAPAGVSFPFAFDQEPASSEEPSIAAEPFSFDVAPSFDLPAPPDALAFGASVESLDLTETVAAEHPEQGAEVIPSFELPAAFELDTSQSIETIETPEVSFEEPTVAAPFAEAVPEFVPEPMPEIETISAPVEEEVSSSAPFGAVAAAATVAAASAVALSSHDSTAVPVSSVVSAPAAPVTAGISQDVMQYIETSLPFIVQKSVDNILKQSGVVRDTATILSGNLSMFDICDVLRLIHAAKLTGKLSVFLQSMTAEMFFVAGKAITVSVSAVNGEKRGFGFQYDLGVMQHKALMVDVVAAIMPFAGGTFSAVHEELSAEMLALPTRVGPVELIEQALQLISPDAVAHRCDPDAVIVRVMDAAALGMLSLGEIDRKVLSVVDGPKPVADVISAAGVDAAGVKKSLYGLMKLGVFAEL